MKKAFILSVVLAGIVGSGLAVAQSPSGSVAEIVNTRRAVMNGLNSLQILIDASVDSGDYDPATLYGLSEAVAASLDAFALLFPPETNLQGGAPPVEGAVTTAAPAIWDDLPGFQMSLHQSAALMREAMETTDLESFKAKWAPVAQACEGCHATAISFDDFSVLN